MEFLRGIISVLLRRRFVRPGAVWLLGAVLLTGAAAQTPPPPLTAEYQVKAVFLFNFAQFVDWPAAAFENDQAPIVIGVLGEDPFGSYLDEVVQSEKIGDRALVVRRYRRVEEALGCHILFIGRSNAAQLDRVLARLQGTSVLTVGDLDNFCLRGGMVRFVTEKGKIHLRINMDVAKAGGLTISSKLLRWATIVTTGKD
ncbi:YfiR family protein [Opitutus sp. GAS368]|uniref:YfiR family protein n=1 Tax=Opitutus sp. GAS368 TaxID=1882749 RepID=UPI00087D91B9|nr:YfiR family protein [Opitutus sp. GAS368]SDR71305.1 protein of unknown function [Opitutus sp. GAS368]